MNTSNAVSPTSSMPINPGGPINGAGMNLESHGPNNNHLNSPIPIAPGPDKALIIDSQSPAPYVPTPIQAQEQNHAGSQILAENASNDNLRRGLSDISRNQGKNVENQEIAKDNETHTAASDNKYHEALQHPDRERAC